MEDSINILETDFSKVEVDKEFCFVIPSIPEAVQSFIPVKVITSVEDLGLIGPGALCSFENLRVLAAVAEFADLFEEVTFVVMSGYPGAQYAEAFNQVTWAFDKVSFDQLVGDLAAQKRIDAIKQDQPKMAGPVKDRNYNEAKPRAFADFERGRGRAQQSPAGEEDIADDNFA